MCISYRIDANDRLVRVSDSWGPFARDNQASELCNATALTPSLWSFISGQEMVYLYKLLLKKVRRDQATLTVPFRCDAPGKRRYMSLKLQGSEAQHVNFTCETVRCEDRPALPILDLDRPRSDQLVSMCSFCKQVACAGNWVEIEEAVAHMRLFEDNNPPRVSHGACPSCYQIVMDQLGSSALT